MDKKLLKAYIRTIVEEEIERLVPKMIKEHLQVSESAELVSETTHIPAAAKPRLDRGELARMLGLSRDGDTLRADTSGLASAPIPGVPANAPKELKDALTKDYSAFMRQVDKAARNRG